MDAILFKHFEIYTPKSMQVVKIAIFALLTVCVLAIFAHSSVLAVLGVNIGAVFIIRGRYLCLRQCRAAGLVLFTFLVLSGCGQAATPTPDPNALRIVLETDPSPLKTGDVTAIVSVRDPRDEPVTGAQVRVTVQMRNVGGYANVTTGGDLAHDLGEGRYSTDLRIDYQGQAEFTIQVDKPGLPQGVVETTLDVR